VRVEPNAPVRSLSCGMKSITVTLRGKTCSKMDKVVVDRVLDRVDALADDLSGDVKRLRNFISRYRLRIGDWRVLFEVEQQRVVI